MDSLSRKLIIVVPLTALWIALEWLAPSDRSGLLGLFWTLVICLILLAIFRIMRLEPVEPDHQEGTVSRRIRRWAFGDPNAPHP
jgi:hypothetical protein